MSENKTDQTDGSRPFEERVFARFDSMDDRFDRIEARLEKLEVRQYDTKPIWEQVLAAIAETNRQMTAGFGGQAAKNESLSAEMAATRNDLSAEIAATRNDLSAEIAALNTKMDTGFDQIRTDLDFSLRGVERKIDVLNQNILDLRAEQRYVDSRLEKLESQPKPS